MLKRIFIPVLLLVIVYPGQGFPQVAEEVVFSGVPLVKISEGGDERAVEILEKDRAVGAECVITKVGDQYLWASRDDTELLLITGGAFLTFVATSGAGYVRVILPELKDVAAKMDDIEKKYDYVEHMLIGLKSITYYGKTNGRPQEAITY